MSSGMRCERGWSKPRRSGNGEACTRSAIIATQFRCRTGRFCDQQTGLKLSTEPKIRLHSMRCAEQFDAINPLATHNGKLPWRHLLVFQCGRLEGQKRSPTPLNVLHFVIAANDISNHDAVGLAGGEQL